jgi:signal transduction histidine kinase
MKSGNGWRRAPRSWDLFIARQIIQAHGGEIRVQSEAETGTTVSVVLPC